MFIISIKDFHSFSHFRSYFSCLQQNNVLEFEWLDSADTVGIVNRIVWLQTQLLQGNRPEIHDIDHRSRQRRHFGGMAQEFADSERREYFDELVSGGIAHADRHRCAHQRDMQTFVVLDFVVHQAHGQIDLQFDFETVDHLQNAGDN